MKPLDQLLYAELFLFFIHNCFAVGHLQVVVDKPAILQKNSKKVVLKLEINIRNLHRC